MDNRGDVWVLDCTDSTNGILLPSARRRVRFAGLLDMLDERSQVYKLQRTENIRQTMQIFLKESLQEEGDKKRHKRHLIL